MICIHPIHCDTPDAALERLTSKVVRVPRALVGA
jgi:type IV secretory pathway ATPase VirB11/archaellum biosynthesis ATPase